MRFSMFYVKGVHGEAYLRIFLHGQRFMEICWRWSKDGTWLKVHDQLYQWVRVDAGREPSPSEAAVDSQERGNFPDDFHQCGL